MSRTTERRLAGLLLAASVLVACGADGTEPAPALDDKPLRTFDFGYSWDAVGFTCNGPNGIYITDDDADAKLVVVPDDKNCGGSPG
jgi:hypothetical protein